MICRGQGPRVLHNAWSASFDVEKNASKWAGCRKGSRVFYLRPHTFSKRIFVLLSPKHLQDWSFDRGHFVEFQLQQLQHDAALFFLPPQVRKSWNYLLTNLATSLCLRLLQNEGKFSQRSTIPKWRRHDLKSPWVPSFCKTNPSQNLSKIIKSNEPLHTTTCFWQ